MAKTRLMRGNTGLYHVEAWVPAELCRIIGRRRIAKSLSTRDPQEALARMPAVAEPMGKLIDDLMAEIRSKMAKSSRRTGIETLIAGVAQPPLPQSPALDAMLENLFVMSSDTTLRLCEADARMLLADVDRLILQFDIPITRYSSKHWQLCRSIARLQKQAIVTGAAMPPPANIVDGELDTAAHQAFIANATLGEVIACFRREFGDRWNPERAQRYSHLFRLMTDIFGSATRIRTISRRNLIEARDILDKLSPEFTWNPHTKYLPVREAAKKCVELGLPPRSRKTVNDQIKRFRSLMVYALAEGFIDKDVTLRLHRPLGPDEMNRGGPFDSDQLTKFFSTGERFGQKQSLEERDERFWVPLISLFGGLRIGEAAQLFVSDIDAIGGIPVFRIAEAQTGNPLTDKFVKTPFSVRVVPIHPILVRIGLIEFAQLMENRGELKLFPNAKRGWARRFDKLAKLMMLDLKRAGIHSKTRTSRSFRHSFRDALRNVKTPDDVVHTLGGWAQEGVPDHYGSGPDIFIR